MKVKFLVVAVSLNSNAFGLRQMVIFTDNGQAWMVLANALHIKKSGDIWVWTVGGGIANALCEAGYELIELMEPDPSVELTLRAFSEAQVQPVALAYAD